MTNCVVDLYHGDTVDPSNGFHSMAAAGVTAIIHKASEGSTSTDPAYSGRAARAAAVGIMWGAYHFAVAGDVPGQLATFLQAVGDPTGVLLALDWEPNGSATMSRGDAEAFVNGIFDQTGRYPVLYSGYSFITDQMAGTQPGDTVLAQCPLWVARYAHAVGALPVVWQNWTIWQYTDGTNGPQPHTVAGVTNPLDRNQYNGTAAELAAAWPL